MKPFVMTPAGAITHSDGTPCLLEEIVATEISVPHLEAHVASWTLPKGEVINVLISYSCHCWTSQHDPDHHGSEQRIMDGVRARVCDSSRFEASAGLPELIKSLDKHRIYVTGSERNYGAYNMSFMAADGLAYTAFFIIRPRRGRFNGIRHRLQLTVESAYHTVQPQVGSKTSLQAALSAGLQGKMVKYRR